MEKNEEIYRSRMGFRQRRPKKEEKAGTQRRGVSNGVRGTLSSTRPYTDEAPQKKRELDLMGTLYTRQRLYQKVNGFSRLLGEIKQGREQALDELEESPSDTTSVESPMIRQTTVQVVKEDTWDW
jgi:hypothetical protein